MPPKSLVELCNQVCIRHVNLITDFGDLPFKLAYPILIRIDNPNHLRQIELATPEYAEETGDLWKRLIAKHFPDWQKKNYVPKNPASWHRVYAKYKKEQEAELAAAESQLKSAFAALANQKESRQSKIVEQRLLPKPPRDGRWIGGRNSGNTFSDLPSSLSFGGGSRTKLTNGQSFLKRAKREAREDANRRALSTPTGQLAVPRGQVAKAPDSMVNEYRVKQQNVLRIHAPRARQKNAAEDAELRQREARLLRIKNAGNPHATQVVVSDSEDDFDKDLFGDDDEAGHDMSPPRKRDTQETDHSSYKRQKLEPNGRKSGNILSNSYRPDAPKHTVRSPPNTAAEPVRRAPQSSLSPPLRPHGSPPAASPDSGLRKRKPDVGIFMRQKKATR
jgi:elongin-A